MNPITVELGSRKKWRNASEWRPINTATCTEFAEYTEGDGYVIKEILANIAENADLNRPVHIMRGETLCFTPTPLNSWVNPPDRRPDHLKGAKK